MTRFSLYLLIVAAIAGCGGGDNNATNNASNNATTAPNNATTANNTVGNNTVGNNTVGNNTVGNNTNNPVELEIPDMPMSGEVVALLTFDGESVTIVCDSANGGQYQAILAGGTLTFNTRNHSNGICGDLQGANFTFLNTPLDDTTDMPEADGGTPIDVQFELDGVETRRSVHDSTAHSFTVMSGRDMGAVAAVFGAVWPDVEMYIWFNEPPFRRF